MIEIIDNFMSEQDFKNLQDFVFGTNFSWFYVPAVSKPDNNIPILNAVETSAFVHKIYGKYENTKSFAYPKFIPLFEKIEDYLNNDYEVFRARTTMTSYKKDFREHNYNLPHVDFPYPHISAVFYLNNSDGDTWIFNEQYIRDNEPMSFSVKTRVQPKANRILIFDGFYYHTASNPITTSTRSIVNLNFIKKNTVINDERFKYLR